MGTQQNELFDISILEAVRALLRFPVNLPNRRCLEEG
jgi:hypothetical protein